MPRALGARFINDEADDRLSFNRPDHHLRLQQPLPSIAGAKDHLPSQETVWEWAANWKCGTISALWDGPVNDGAVLKNTRNPQYDGTILLADVWHIDPADVLREFPFLGDPYNYNYPPFDASFKPTAQHQRDILAPYCLEAGLVSRLDELLWPDLFRVQKYLAFLMGWKPNLDEIEPQIDDVEPVPKQSKPKVIPIFTAPGGDATSYGHFLADRCGLPSDYQVNHNSYIFGDIKPSYKFSGDWIDLLHEDKRKTEYLQVLGQVTFYLRSCVSVDEALTARYGFVVTEKDVILIERFPDNVSDVQVAGPFPLQIKNEELPVTTLTGMQALIYIHLKAGLDGLVVGEPRVRPRGRRRI